MNTKDKIGISNESKKQTNYIPILNERYDEKTPSATVLSSLTTSERNNPFLPYETLEKLAKERIQFQQQLSEFGQYFEIPAPPKLSQTVTDYRARKNNSRKTTKIDSIEALVKSTTQSVLEEYSAEIEMEIYRRVKTKLLGA